jgi:uncharacterized protein YunC (DUF1805 family)
MGQECTMECTEVFKLYLSCGNLNSQITDTNNTNNNSNKGVKSINNDTSI